MFDNFNLHEILEIKSKISKRFVILLQRNTTTNLVPRARDLQGKNRELWDNP